MLRPTIAFTLMIGVLLPSGRLLAAAVDPATDPRRAIALRLAGSDADAAAAMAEIRTLFARSTNTSMQRDDVLRFWLAPVLSTPPLRSGR